MTHDQAAAFGITYLGVVVAVYLIPGMVAGFRKHPNKLAIIALNIFLGWTFIGWLAALIWALVKPAPAPVPSQTVIYMMPQTDGTIQPVMPLPTPALAANPYVKVENRLEKVPMWARLLAFLIVVAIVLIIGRMA